MIELGYLVQELMPEHAILVKDDECGLPTFGIAYKEQVVSVRVSSIDKLVSDMGGNITLERLAPMVEKLFLKGIEKLKKLDPPNENN